MTIYSIILSSLTIIILIVNVVIFKKFPLLFFLLTMLDIVFILIKTIDPTYYSELISDGNTSEDIESIVFAYSFILFVFCLLKFLVRLLKENEKVNYGRNNTALISNQKASINNILTNKSYKQTFEEFNTSKSPMIIIDKKIMINKVLQDLLEKNGEAINDEELNKIIDENDKDAYLNGAYFRIKYRSFSDWFEKRDYVYCDRVISVIKRIDNKSYSSITIGGFKELSRRIAILDNSISNYGIILFRITHIYECNNKQVLEVNEESKRIVLICKYLVSIRDFFKNQSLDIYKLENEEFAYLIKNNVSLDFLIDKININDNILNNFCYFLGESKYIVCTKAVICKEYERIDVDSNILDGLLKEMNKINSEKNNASILNNKKIKEERNV